MRKKSASQSVGVIFTKDDLRRAKRLRNRPDLFELRLDALRVGSGVLEDAIRTLGAPVIITARHPSEGGVGRLSTRERKALFLHFLPWAACVDVELRFACTMTEVLQESRAKNVRIIISYHDLRSTPRDRELDKIGRRARAYKADILKVVTRTDSQAQLSRLREFFLRERRKIAVSVMGLGRLGRLSRIEFVHRGSALNYAHLGNPRVAGQFSLRELRRVSGKILHLP